MQLLLERISNELKQVSPNSRCVIWGTGELGETFLKHISQQFPEFDVLGFTSSTQTSIELEGEYGLPIYPSEHLLTLLPDVVVVASVRFEKEIVSSAETLCTNIHKNTQIIYFSQNLNCIEKELKDHPSNFDKKRVVELLFRFPDSIELWRKMQAFSAKEEGIYSQCAAVLDKE